MDFTKNQNKLQALRELMKGLKLNAFIVGSADAHRSEYVCDRDLRRSFISEFSGSAGTALITADRALLWTDGRYFDQAEQELDGESWTLMKSGEPGVMEMNDWLFSNLSRGDVVGADSFLMTASEALGLKKKLSAKGIDLMPVENNPVDQVWNKYSKQPDFPTSRVMVHKGSGCPHGDKIAKLREELKSKGAGAFLVTMLDEIAWLLNIRGADVECNPVTVAYVVVTMEKIHLFIDSAKLDEEATAHLGGVEVAAYDQVEQFLSNLRGSGGGPIALDPAQANWRVYNAAGGAEAVVPLVSPLALAKSIKNNQELKGIRECHIRDGVALTAFLCWLEQRIKAEPRCMTEYDVATEIERFRGKMSGHVSPSFATVAGYGSNGAVIHYKPEKETALPLDTDSLFLLDSGGQYLDGTTDVTRTLHFGASPSAYMKKCYTLVLKGHIALARLVFPEGTVGSRLDALARLPLWSQGLDYNHGTGHGVGAFLNVHEGPQGIGFRKRENEAGFAVGMTTSNEPGYYESGAFGIRIENVCITVEADTPHNFNGRRYCKFETVTMTPIKTDLMDLSMLDDDEIRWVDDYHAEVRHKLLPGMREHFPEAVDYLLAETEPLS